MKKSILLILLSLLMVTTALATVVQIGNGSELLYEVPLHAAQNYSWSHFILPGNAITNTGLITKLEFNVRNTLDGSYSSDQHVFMRLTNATTVTNAYTANPGSNGYTEIFDGSIRWNTDNWQGIELTTPFAYNGTSNLEIIWENRRGGWNPYSPVFTGTQSSQAAAYKSGEQFPEAAGSSVGAYPNTRVTWQYSPIGLTCADPIPLNFPAINIMGNTANYENNYSSNMITGGDIDARYINGNDVVYQFTLAEPRVLNGTIITSASWMGAFILQQEPNATTPAPVILSKKSWDGNTITYNDDVLLSGTYYLIISSYPAPQSLDYTINLTATITTPQGSTCSNPIPLTFPATGITGNTADYGDDYDFDMVSPNSNYLKGSDVVYQFTLDNPRLLNGTITTTGTWIGALILQEEPNSTSAAPVILSKTSGSGNTLTYSENLLPAGTYYLIISSYPSPQSLDYTINLTTTRPQGSTCANPIPLTFPATGITGNTAEYGNDYGRYWITPSTIYLEGDDVVYQFTLTEPVLLNGTITTTKTYIGAYILQEEPNAATPPSAILRKWSEGYSISYTNNMLSAGTYYLIISSYSRYNQSLDYNIDLTAERVQGSTCANPIPLTFPATGITGNTAEYGDDYNHDMVDPQAGNLTGDDVVYQFTLDNPRLLNGTITTTKSWFGAYILEEEPNADNPASIVLSKLSGPGRILTYDNNLLPAGTYYLIISSHSGHNQSLDYNIDLTAERVQGSTCANPIPLTFPATNISGNTANYGDDYDRMWISPASFYITGDDVVYQFTLDIPMVLNGAITTSHDSPMGAYILQAEPNVTNPAPVNLSKITTRRSLDYTDEILSAGTYFLIISSYPGPQSLNYTINLAATDLTIPDVASILAPADGATNVLTSDDLIWNDARHAAGYKVYLSTDNTFTGVTPIHTTSSIYWDTDFDYATTYYWKIIPYNELGQPTTAIPVWSFTTVSNPFPGADVVFDGRRSDMSGLPMNAESNYSMSQSIYPSSELNLENAITSISYLYNKRAAWSETIEVFMKHTSKDDFDSNNDWETEGFSHVYSGSIAVNTTDEIVTILLDTPFTYNNSDNLMVMFFATQAGSSDYSSSFYEYDGPHINSLVSSHGTTNYYDGFPSTFDTGSRHPCLPVTGFNYNAMSEPNFTVSTETLTFAEQMMATESEPQSLTISNLGGNDLGINSIHITGANARDFRLIEDYTYPVTLGALGEMSVSIIYAPALGGEHTAQLEITDNQDRVVHTIQLVGNAISLQGATCADPIPLTFPTGQISGTTEGYGNDYQPGDVNPRFGDLENSEDIVYQFTLAEDMFLSGTITGVTSTGISTIFLQDEPNATNPAPTTISVCSGHSNTLNFTNEIFPAGTYYLIVFGNKYVRHLGYTINLTTEPFLIADPITEFPWSEDFASWPPAGYWHQFRGSLRENTSISTGTKWHHAPFINNGEIANSASLNLHGQTNDLLVSPSIDLDANVLPLQLTFDADLTTNDARSRATLGSRDKVAVVISTDDGATWSNTNILREWVSGDAISSNAGSYALPLDAYSGIVKFGFYVEIESSPTPDLALFFDNIGVSTIVSSIFPQPNTDNAILSPTISFTASEEYTHYELYFGDAVDETTLIVENTPITNPVMHTFEQPLALCTDYYWKVVLAGPNSNAATCNFTFRTEHQLYGLGNEEHPYEIDNIEDLISVSKSHKLWDKHFIQTANIDASITSTLNGGVGFSPIGNFNHIFTGAYNGANYTISNLHINRPDSNFIGLFGYASGATMSNIGLINNHTLGNDRVGGLVGWSRNNSTITNCYATGSVEGSIWVGGLAGLSTDDSTINNSYAAGNVPGANEVGGLVGLSYNNSTITNCYATGAVDGRLSGVGGLVGTFSGNSIINNSYATGLVTGPTEITGGLVGHCGDNPESIVNSFWDTETSGQTVSAGGEGKTTIEMTDANTYLAAGWDFATMWLTSLDINSGYPVFSDKYIKNVSPLNYSTFVSVTPTISFEIAEGYASYELYFGDEANPVTQIVANSPINNPVTYTFTEPLEPRTDYYWSVVLYGANRNGVSLSFTFKTEYLMDGSGSELDPYQIAILDDLIALSESETLWNKHFIQTADINASTTSGLNAGKGFNPIGYFDETETGGFTGSYNGNHMTISNLYINRPEEGYIGLFACANGADISNVRLLDNNVYGNSMVGSLVGNSFNESTISNCYATGSVNGEYYAGGLVGASNGATISKCYATGAVEGHTYIGGLVGMAYLSSTISNSYATGSVTGAHGVGGLAGIYGLDSTINNSYANGAVQSDAYAGGLVGLCDNGPGGEAPCTMSNSFWDTETSGQTDSDGGEGKTTIEMTNANTYLTAGWDFDNIWFASLNFNSGYPVFSDKYLRNISPLNNSTSVSIIPTISFEVAEVCSSYELYFGEEPNPVNQIIPNSPINNPVAYTFTEPLEPYTDYYWSVVLYGADRNELNLKFTFKTGAPFDGSGTEDEPYEIANFNDLLLVSQQETLWDKHFIQTANINASLTSELNEGAGFSPIGNDDIEFTGSYNGGIYTISNLYINRPDTLYVGLFGSALNSNITNVGLLDVQVVGYGGTGGLAGWVRNCTISNSYVTGLVSSGSLSHTGGLLGAASSYSTISNSYSTCVVIGNHHAGGLVGFLDRSTINNCYATGAISGAGYNERKMGGLVGTILQSTLNNSYATGSVTGKEKIGGLVGNSTDASTVNNSYATGDVSGNTEVGGLVGFYERGSIITNSYATGFVSARTVRTGESIGGLVGAVDDHSDPYFGPCKAVNSFWNTETTGQTTSISGEGKTTAEMRDPSTYLTPEWDITEQEDLLGEYVWKINAEKNDGYPYLVWAAANIENDDNTLPVTLSSFMATQTAENCAKITWTTESESSLLGYNIFRSITKDEDVAIRINSTMIEAENTSVGSSYSYLDDKVVGNTIYYYWLQVNEFDGSSTFHGPYQIRVEENFNNQGVVIPLKTTLRNVYPNPFNPTTTVSFYLAKPEKIRINIYNIKGQLTSGLVNETLAKGFHDIVWNGKNANGQNCASGIYFFRMETQSEVQMTKGILMK